ncbi:amidase signature domain-containing protein [Lasiosphaeris hirsuta]|uniref:Amidase signature domain-containing protein n=1 Tax=Lasiosphaeris hirsuta TaxID=260670 RepID=A0AA40DLA0_9PEZI|nr:amidase signature domain-containing protein [Lasiosphaeris hirsuta]
MRFHILILNVLHLPLRKHRHIQAIRLHSLVKLILVRISSGPDILELAPPSTSVSTHLKEEKQKEAHFVREPLGPEAGNLSGSPRRTVNGVGQRIRRLIETPGGAPLLPAEIPSRVNRLGPIDYHCPFNPRADGYLVPEGSSSGSAIAVAAYDWLDAGFGTDTSASLRAPAAAQGILGLRTSHGALSTEPVIPLVPRFDVVGFMARDIGIVQLLAAELFPRCSSPRS